MMKRIDNIVIGDLVEGVTLEMLGVCDDEVTIHITEDDAREADFFLPRRGASKRTGTEWDDCVMTSVYYGAI